MRSASAILAFARKRPARSRLPLLNVSRITKNGSNSALGIQTGCSYSSLASSLKESNAASPQRAFKQLDERIFLIENFLSSEECNSLIAASESMGFSEAGVDTKFRRGDASSGDAILNKEIRNNFRLPVSDSELASALYTRFSSVNGFETVSPALETPEFKLAGRFSNLFRFYRYQPGQQFKPHPDGILVDKETGFESRWTFLMQLNDDFVGGETAFLHRKGASDAAIVPKPVKGQAILFHHRLLHEGRAVLQGTKYVLRTDLMMRKYENPSCRWLRDI